MNLIVTTGLFVLLSGLAMASHAETVENKIQKRLTEKLGAGFKADEIVATAYNGLYEVRSGNSIMYTDKDGRFLMRGELVDVDSRINVTSERLEDLSKVPFESLPFEQSFKVVKGNGKRELAIFEDPNCGYCKKLEQSLVKLNDVTIHVFLYPVLGEDSTSKAKAIWCSSDRSKSWLDWMQDKKEPHAASECEHPLTKNVKFGQAHQISGTPTIFMKNGKRIRGAVPIERIEALLEESATVAKVR